MRRPLRVLLSLLLAALLPLGAACAEGCTIVHLSDLHYLSPTLTDGGEAFMTLLREGDGVAARILAGSGVELKRLYDDLMSALGG